jgi:uncharacterized protein (DUF433 family)
MQFCTGRSASNIQRRERFTEAVIGEWPSLVLEHQDERMLCRTGSRKENGMEWQDRISVDPKVLVGKPVIKGTRISVEFLRDLMANGWTHEQILANYPHLTEDDLQAALRKGR